MSGNGQRSDSDHEGYLADPAQKIDPKDIRAPESEDDDKKKNGKDK